MLVPVGGVLLGDAAHEGVVGVTVREEGAHREEHFRDGQSRAPVVLEDVQADRALTVDVAVVDSRAEYHLGNEEMEGIIKINE